MFAPQRQEPENVPGTTVLGDAPNPVRASKPVCQLLKRPFQAEYRDRVAPASLHAALSLSLSHTHTHSLSLSLWVPAPRRRGPGTPCPQCSPSGCCRAALSLSVTHIHTHTLSLSLSVTHHTYTRSLSLSSYRLRSVKAFARHAHSAPRAAVGGPAPLHHEHELLDLGREVAQLNFEVARRGVYLCHGNGKSTPPQNGQLIAHYD